MNIPFVIFSAAMFGLALVLVYRRNRKAKQVAASKPAPASSTGFC